MKALTLHYPIHTLDNRTLCDAGTVISHQTLEKLIALNPQALSPAYPMLRYGKVREDILNFINRHPYNTIFSNGKQKTLMLSFMERIHLISPILESLDFFKRHDYYTYRHILMVFSLTTVLAQILLKDEQDLIRDVMAGPTHDIGKICVPLKILKKETPLTVEERRHLEHHVVAGYVLLSYHLKDSKNLSTVIARDHHERKDGSGYPRGVMLTGQLAEIVIVSDIYDALISPRPYRPTSFDNRSALEEITAVAEQGKISWNVVQALVALNRKDQPHFMDCNVSIDKRGVPPKDNLYGVFAG